MNIAETKKALLNNIKLFATHPDLIDGQKVVATTTGRFVLLSENSNAIRDISDFINELSSNDAWEVHSEPMDEPAPEIEEDNIDWGSLPINVKPVTAEIEEFITSMVEQIESEDDTLDFKTALATLSAQGSSAYGSFISNECIENLKVTTESMYDDNDNFCARVYVQYTNRGDECLDITGYELAILPQDGWKLN